MKHETVSAAQDFSPQDFEPVNRMNNHHTLSRPSVAYWQDAWWRLKKNKQAYYSLCLILFMMQR